MENKEAEIPSENIHDLIRHVSGLPAVAMGHCLASYKEVDSNQIIKLFTRLYCEYQRGEVTENFMLLFCEKAMKGMLLDIVVDFDDLLDNNSSSFSLQE